MEIMAGIMTDYCRSDVFRHIWTWSDTMSVSIDNQLDVEFEKFFKTIMQSVEAGPPTLYQYLLPRERVSDANTPGSSGTEIYP